MEEEQLGTRLEAEPWMSQGVAAGEEVRKGHY